VGWAYGGCVDRRDLFTAGLISLGGVLGALTRYGADQLWPWHPPAFPWTTAAINVVGCLAIGLLLVWVLEGPPTPWWLRPLVAVGAIGGFTTFSAFAIEAVLLSDEGAVASAGLYVALTVVLGLIAVWLSVTLARRVLLPRGRGETHP